MNFAFVTERFQLNRVGYSQLHRFDKLLGLYHTVSERRCGLWIAFDFGSSDSIFLAGLYMIIPL